VVADPGHRQIRQDVLIGGQAIEIRPPARRADEGVVRQTHTLGLAGRPRGIQHDADIIGGARSDLGAQQIRVIAVVNPPHGHQLADVVDERQRVMAHAARVVVEQMLELRQFGVDLEHLVDLLLVFDKDEADFRVEQDKQHFAGHGVLVKGQGHAPEALRGGHHHVHARPVLADDGQVLAPSEAHFGESTGDRTHLLGDIVPGPALPDAQVLLAHRRFVAADPRVLQQQARKVSRAWEEAISRILSPPVHSPPQRGDGQPLLSIFRLRF
jgi:hypothetical protein